ncbi:MAG: hypothetical protein KBS41_03280 [Oscillospiraceae bacterium]|nr:hypothetical protein [Candidatus Equicaccousia limihippi]
MNSGWGKKLHDCFQRPPKIRQNPTKKALQIVNMQVPTADPLGSYTGTPENRFEKPTQDADDL